MPKKPVGIRLSDEATTLVERLKKLFHTKAAVFEAAIRELARKHKIKVKDHDA